MNVEGVKSQASLARLDGAFGGYSRSPSKSGKKVKSGDTDTFVILFMMPFKVIAAAYRFLMGLRSEEILSSVSGIDFERKRLEEVRRLHAEAIAVTGNTSSLRRIKEVVLNTEAMGLAITFTRRHLEELAGELRRGAPIGSTSEDIDLFFKLMATKCRIERPEMMHLVLYINSETAYVNYRDALDRKKPHNPSELIQQTAINDVYNNHEVRSERVVKRYAKENNIDTQGLDLVRMQHDERERLRLSQMEKDLNASDDKVRGSINERIRFTTKEAFFQAANRHKLSTAASDYIVAGIDHSRASRIDSAYRRLFKMNLIEKFSMRCAKCLTLTTDLELDHFWMPKSQGGNFAMRSREGRYVNNCIPLCKPCNSSKGARHFLDFFSLDEVEKIITHSQELNSMINASLAELEDVHFGEYREEVA